MEDSDDDFDIIQPTLIKQLRKILDQYPDDGQILKELIQNAEDAGASNVKFLCDYHRYGTEKLHHPELDKFQGPALYAYNNERFTAEDWKGIRTLCDSIKENDPMKVGRFGLGFKSVFHMTDLPSIVSDKQVGILDPHQQYFTNRTGHRWRFKQDREKMDQIPDQFAPYKDIVGFGAESFSSRCDGTLFRFPLREKPSMLSDNLYSPKKVLDLLECFQVDAHMVLLFLKNIESIELYVRGNKECSPRKTFEVKIADESIQNVRAKRKEFIDAVRHLKHGEVPSSPVSVTYPISIECTSYEGHECTVRHSYKYLVTNYFSGGHMAADVKALLESEDLSYLPWVGVAMAVEHAKTTVDRKGHLFCFLPLPVQKNSLTGLPVHVNGFFALSQNRRHLKWPTADQEEGGKELTDKALQWNKFLVKDVVSCAYADLLLQSRKEVPVEDFYKSWPDPEKTDPKWQEMLPLLFERLLKCATFHTTVNGGMWLKINEAIFDTVEEDSQTRKVLLNALKAANTRIVSIPHCVINVIDVIASYHVITPNLVRSVLRQTHSCYKNSGRSEKLLLLKYSLKDSRFDDLYDLELLPLSNGKFSRFVHGGQPSCEPIYISSVEHPQSLLPGLDHLFLDSSIEESVAMQLKAVATRGHPQLKHLDQNAIIKLLPRSFPRDWSSGDQVTWYPGNSNKGHPTKEWLDSVWRYLSKYFPRDLSVLQNQPLIPISRSVEKVTLARLRSPSVSVLQSTQVGRLDVTVVKVLKSLGITIISKLPWSVMSHPAILENYVHSPSVSSVLQAMMTLASACGCEVIVDRLQRQSPSDKRALRDFLAKAPLLSPRERELVQHLPLFETLQGIGFRASRFVACRKICKAAPRKVLPVRVSQELIDISQGYSKALAKMSGVKMLKTTELLNEIVFQDVMKGTYSGSDIDKLMEHVFSNFSKYEKEMPEFQNIVKNLRFVPKRGGVRVKPSDLFDPTVTSLQTILAGEDVFPIGPVYTKRGALVMLSQLGLKGKNSLTARDVLKSARHTEKVLPAENAWRKSRALLEHLNSNIHMLLGTVDGQTLGNWLKGLPWVHTMTAGPPRSYPRSLPFCSLGDGVLMKPTQVTSSTFVDIIGSVKSVVGIGSDSLQSIASFFAWTKEPDTGEVIAHLKNVVDCYTQTEKPTYMSIVKKIYQHLLGVHPNKLRTALLELGGLEWVWNGDGFSSPSTVVFVKPFTDLSPYICLLPSEVVGFKDVFKAGGTRDEGERSLLLRVLQLMKEKYDQGQNHKRDVKRDLQLSIDILNELKSSSRDCLESNVKESILIPTNGTDDSTLRLAPIEECTYCDVEWLKQGHDTSDVDEDGYTRNLYVHRNIPNDTAETLGVPSLMSRMLDAEELELGEEFGQEEPLTCSIRRLLEGYTDGFAVPKELIQNADDAGATEVKFLYDERTNEDSMTCLFDKGMKACQGPALWVYNNAVFTDEDFTNITKLNGATKERDTEKIGRFGSGFNAVYNLTDVPSFVSRNSFAMFDPHKTHLGKAIKNGKPGIRINLKKNKQKLRKLSNQFKPFNGIFGCDLRPEAGQDSYDGTLFRFPLRTKEQAVKSELKDLYYSDQEMRKLLNKLLEGAESLLLFTQTVCRVSVYHLPRGSSGIPQPEKLFEVNKTLNKVIQEVSFPFPLPPTIVNLNDQDQYFAKQSSFLRASSHALRTMNCAKDFPRSSMVVDVEIKHTKKGTQFLGVNGVREHHCSWLLSSTMGIASALEFAKKDNTLIPTAGVAVRLRRMSPEIFIPNAIVESKNNSRHTGKVFCYLPLPLHSGISVHVNGFFAVTSNRRDLQERTEDDKCCHGGDWNEMLMKDAVSEAYTSALDDLRSLPSVCIRSCNMYELWPRADQVTHVCQPLVKSFYRRLSAIGPNALSLFSDGMKWVSIDRVVFLDPDLRHHYAIGDIAFHVFEALPPDSKVVADLPSDIMEAFRQCGYEDAIKQRTFSTERFYNEIFLPNINLTQSVDRDRLVLHAIDEDNLISLLKGIPCIPASPEGKNLKRPGELVHPNGDVSSLYCSKDGMFPHGAKETFLSPVRLEKLTEELGMRTYDICWTEVVERAQSIHTLSVLSADHEGALKRTRVLMGFLNKKLSAEDEQVLPPSIRKNLMEATFLPILAKPENYPLRWKGDDYGPWALLAPTDVFVNKQKNLVSCSWPILNDATDGCGHLTGETAAFLGLQEKKVSMSDVKAQLETVIAYKCGMESVYSYKEMRKMLYSIYKYLQAHLDQNRDEIIDLLAEKTFILGETHLLCAKQVAFDFQIDCPPYLYKLPTDLTSEFRRLMTEAGVRPSFDAEDYVTTLELLKEKFGDDILDDDTIMQTVALASMIHTCVKGERVTRKADIYLPDTQNRLYLSSELCMNDCNWMSEEEGVKYVHSMIPQETCIDLGVNTRRGRSLRNCSIGIPFGQHEKLTTRLKNILKAYPCEDGLLKELLQNADDAQATELCFIKDPRHHGEDRVFEDSWKPLQGPALCVFNNKPFTAVDIAGIQNLGQGSKSDDPNKTGQYGLGFNAVYHLTDAPSFLSKGGEMGNVLCVFDPQHKFVPGATSQMPGQMFTDIDKQRQKFTDVFPCYLEKQFPVDNLTMFRFPLRTEKMAKQSDISTTPMTVEDLGLMMDKFKPEMFDALLFVNCVRKISLCEVANDGELVNHYDVTATLSKDDTRKRTEFSTYVGHVVTQLREKQLSLCDVQMKEVSYVVNLKDTEGWHEKWLVVQRIGFESAVDVPDSVFSAFQAGDLTLLPRGGVASLLQGSTFSLQTSKPKKAFCFLPLPFETNLPVHVNGHFALDHGARRNLWRDGRGGYRSDWNNSLLHWLIAPSYVSLLATVRKHLQLPVGSGEMTLLECEIQVAQRRIATYLSLFPSLNLEDTYWVTLSRDVYEYVGKKEVHLLPVLRIVPTHTMGFQPSKKCILEITWLSPNGQGKAKAFFNNLNATPRLSCPVRAPRTPVESKQPLGNILLDTGFNLLQSPLDLYHNFIASGVGVECLSPLAVLTFFRSYSSHQPLCDLGRLPRPVLATPFKDVSSVVCLLNYIKGHESFPESLQGLPLLVTEDGTLGVFDCSSPVFLTNHVDVLPQCASEVVHHTLRKDIFHDGDLKMQKVFKAFDIDSLATNLHRILPDSTFCAKNGYVQWTPGKRQGIPTKVWIMQLWRFLANETKDILQQRDLDDAKKGKEIASRLRPLNDWCLLPATETGTKKDRLRKGTPQRHLLVPVGMADTIITFGNGNYMPDLKKALRAFSLPELNCTIIDAGSAVVNYSEPARMIAANLGNPSQVLRALLEKIRCSSLEIPTLGVDYEHVLQYFRDHIELLREKDKDVLRLLPFYRTVHGEYTALSDRTVYVLPRTIRKEGIKVLQAKTGAVFLKEDPILSKLHTFLGSTSCSEIDFYCDFIFPYFSDMTPRGQRTHLEVLKRLRLTVLEESDKARLLNCLRGLRFLPAEVGSLQTASSFYDPEQPVFKEMLQPCLFPPDPFSCPQKWLPFLREIGLVQEVTTKHFMSLAQQIAAEARMSRSDHTQVKSEVLLKHLFQRPNVATEGLLEKICQIPFIHPCKVSGRLSRVYPQFGVAPNGQLPYICFEGAVVNSEESIAWTSAPLLPKSADPTHHGNYYINDCKEIIRRLGILQLPTTEQAVSHCENICFHWDKENNTSDQKREILLAIYKFLSCHRSQVAKCRLQNVPCILLNNQHLAFVRQIVLEFPSEHEIKPYLFRAPVKLGEFHSLFLFLGSTQVVTVEQYAMVLMEIQRDAGNAKLEPNEMRKAFQAVKGLFEILENTAANDIELPFLYLPGAKKEEPKRVLMRKSTELVYDDAPQLRKRITRFDEMLLVDLQQCELKAANFGRLMEMLPERFRPRMLTTLVQEILSETAGEAFLQGSIVKLRHLLETPHFSRAIVRLIRHEDVKTKRKTGSTMLASVKKCLSGINVYGIQSLKTHLSYQGEIIPDSEMEKTCFDEKVAQGWNVYLETSGDHEKTWIFEVAKIVNEITGDLLLKDALIVLPQLLTCTPLEIDPLLDDLGILEDRTSDVDETPYLPQSGTFIHIEDHYLLNDTFDNFEPGEFVGYELSDPSLESENDTPTFIYAVIIEEVKPEGAQTVSFLKKRYKIDVGKDKGPIEVDAVDLYKFRRIEGSPYMQMVPYEGDESAPSGSTPWTQSKNLEDVMNEITELLEEACTLLKEKRDKIIKRLYLTWHPDKNAGNEEFCTTVFQYLRNEIKRIERREPHKSGGETSTPGFNPDYFNGGLGSFFRSWNARAQTHRRQYDHFQEDNGSSGFHFNRANPQPGEAKRWFRQAKADLDAASNDLSGAKPSYEWVCFKCHQAAEKALKAAQYSKDANKTNQHNLSLNASSLDNAELSRLASDLEGLLGDSTRMRYPDRTRFPNIPHDVYDREMAIQAQDYAEQILAAAKRYIDSRI